MSRIFIPRINFKLLHFLSLLPDDIVQPDVFWFESSPTIPRLFEQEWDSDENKFLEASILFREGSLVGWPRFLIEKYDHEVEYWSIFAIPEIVDSEGFPMISMTEARLNSEEWYSSRRFLTAFNWMLWSEDSSDWLEFLSRDNIPASVLSNICKSIHGAIIDAHNSGI